jgi:hypothetical protein
LWLVEERWRGRELVCAFVVCTRGRRGDSDAGCTRIVRAFEVVHLPVEVGSELVAVHDATVLRLELFAVEADKEGAHIVEEPVDPRQVDKTLVDGDKDEAEVLGRRPLQRVALLAVRRFRAGVLGLRLDALLNKNVADQAVDHVCADGGVGTRP